MLGAVVVVEVFRLHVIRLGLFAVVDVHGSIIVIRNIITTSQRSFKIFKADRQSKLRGRLYAQSELKLHTHKIIKNTRSMA